MVVWCSRGARVVVASHGGRGYTAVSKSGGDSHIFIGCLCAVIVVTQFTEESFATLTIFMLLSS